MSHESRTQLGLLNSWMFFSRSNIDCVSNKMDGPRPFLGRFWIQSCLFLRLVTVTVLKISFRPIILDVYLNSELLSPTQAKEPNLPVFRPILSTKSSDPKLEENAFIHYPPILLRSDRNSLGENLNSARRFHILHL